MYQHSSAVEDEALCFLDPFRTNRYSYFSLFLVPLGLEVLRGRLVCRWLPAILGFAWYRKPISGLLLHSLCLPFISFLDSSTSRGLALPTTWPDIMRFFFLHLKSQACVLNLYTNSYNIWIEKVCTPQNFIGIESHTFRWIRRWYWTSLKSNCVSLIYMYTCFMTNHKIYTWILDSRRFYLCLWLVWVIFTNFISSASKSAWRVTIKSVKNSQVYFAGIDA